MRKFMLAAAVLAVAACGEKAAEETTPMEEAAPAPATEMAPATPDTTTPDSATAMPDSATAAAPAN